MSKLNSKCKQKQEGVINVTFQDVTTLNFKQLQHEWLTLESKSTPKFFLRWKWIGSWLKLLSPQEKIILLKAHENDNIVALGVFIERKTIRHGILKSTQWFLHRTGDSKRDQIWIENNDFLIANHNKKNITKTIWQVLLSKHAHVDEFIVAINHNSLEQEPLLESQKYKALSLYKEPGYHLSLIDITSIEEYLSTLSKNTKKQIKRSTKLLHQLGIINFIVEHKPEKQLKILEHAKQWHINKWNDTETPSGFKNNHFISFHNALVQSEQNTAQTIVASLSIDNNLYGCLYCFIDNNCAYFYLSGIKPIEDNRIKLGLTLHTLFIEWLIENNPTIKKYDFLAGKARYKHSLSNNQDTYSYLVIQKQTLKFKIENKLKELKQSLRQIFN